jgi:hypothetical protein
MSRAAVATTTRMAAEEMGRASASAAAAATAEAAPVQAGSRWARLWPPSLRWIPTSTDRIIAAEKRLLSIVKYDPKGPSNLPISGRFNCSGIIGIIMQTIYQITACQLVQSSGF